MEYKLPRLSDRIAIGTLSASPFCVGIVDDPDTIGAAYDAGINFFFLTADMPRASCIATSSPTTCWSA
ncbi:MAG: hypothetical protein WKG01_02505, partial [Kofleriaceae bacterium]